MRKQIRVEDLISSALETERATTYRAFPAIVQAFHPGSQNVRATVDVQVSINDVRFDLDTGDRISEPFPIITGVPVLYPKGAGFIIQFPLQAGDEVQLVSYDLDPTPFRTTGKRSDPQDVRRHGGSYWWATPGGIADPNAPQSGGAAGTALVIGQDGGSLQIQINGSTINLGASPTSAVALSQKIDALINVLVATYTPSGTESGFAALVTALQTFKATYWTASTTVGASLVKGQ